MNCRFHGLLTRGVVLSPDQQQKASNDVRPERSPLSPAEGRPDEAPLRVLVVDDSAAERHLLSAVLRRSGYEVANCGSAAAALALMVETEPQIVICDWMMPGLSGPDFCARIRAQERDAYIYVLMLTAITEKDAAAHVLDIGADDFLTKPFDPNELRARVRAGARMVELQAARLAQNRKLSDALVEIRDLYDAIERDLAQARDLQQALLPDPVTDHGAAVAGFLLRSAGKVGGDLVGEFQAGPGRVGFYSLDVSGHGVTSAFITVRMAALFADSSPERNVALTRGRNGEIRVKPPADIVEDINTYFMGELETDLYLTLCIVILDLETGTAALVQAGHPHPLVRRADGRVEQLGTGGLPVGLIFDAPYDAVQVTLAPGDQLFLQSDGFVECPAAADGEMLGDEGLEAMLREIAPGDPGAALETLMAQLSDYAGTSDFPDDVSGLMIEYRGSAA